MRYVVNKLGTVRWDEIPPDTLMDWAKEDENAKERQKIFKDFFAKARHGDILVYGVNRILAVDLV